MIVSSYGLHWAEGSIPFLVQQSGAQNLISPDLPCPFIPNIRPKRMRCPHQINLAQTVSPPDWATDDPLAEVFLPTPAAANEKAKLIFDPDGSLNDLLVQLSRLSSPTEGLSRPIWWKFARDEHWNYSVSNLSPLVWTHCSIVQAGEAVRHIELAQAHRRRILIVAKEKLPIFGSDAEWIETGLGDVSGEPLEMIGAAALKRRMQDGR